MGDPAPMHTHYADTIDFDWAAHFVRQSESGLTVTDYCKQNRCSTRTWYHIKRKYDQCADETQFKHVKKRTGIEPLLSSSGEKAVDNALQRTSKLSTQQSPSEQTNSAEQNTYKNTDYYFTLLNTVSASGGIHLPFFITSKRHINKFKIPAYEQYNTDDNSPIFQHNSLKFYVSFSKSGSVTSDLMSQYITKVVASGDTSIHLFLDFASTHRTMQFRLHCSMKNVALYHIPANTTHILQVNDLVVFAQVKGHLAHLHDKLIAEQRRSSTIEWDVEYTAHYILNTFKRGIISYCFHYVAHATITELRIKNNVFKSYKMYRTTDAFNARSGIRSPNTTLPV